MINPDGNPELAQARILAKAKEIGGADQGPVNEDLKRIAENQPFQYEEDPCGEYQMKCLACQDGAALAPGWKCDLCGTQKPIPLVIL